METIMNSKFYSIFTDLIHGLRTMLNILVIKKLVVSHNTEDPMIFNWDHNNLSK